MQDSRAPFPENERVQTEANYRRWRKMMLDLEKICSPGSASNKKQNDVPPFNNGGKL